MARSTSYIFNPQARSGRSDGNTIVAGANLGVEDGDVRRPLDMNAIGVRAVSGGVDLHAFHSDLVAPIEDNVELLAIVGDQVANVNVVGVAKSQCLHAHNKNHH